MTDKDTSNMACAFLLGKTHANIVNALKYEQPYLVREHLVQIEEALRLEINRLYYPTEQPLPE
jgi:hypothetical protein